MGNRDPMGVGCDQRTRASAGSSLHRAVSERESGMTGRLVMLRLLAVDQSLVVRPWGARLRVRSSMGEL